MALRFSVLFAVLALFIFVVGGILSGSGKPSPVGVAVVGLVMLLRNRRLLLSDELFLAAD